MKPGALRCAASRLTEMARAITKPYLGLALGGLCAGAAPALFPVTEATLTNGLRVFILEDHNHPLVAVHVWYHVGSVDEPAGRRGFAHLFEHMMFRGTDRLGPTDHMELIHSVGGTCNAFTSFDETAYHQTLPAQQLELALWLESERMAFLTVDGAGFATERKVVEEERRMGLNQPYGDIVDKAPPIFFGEHPYSHSPLGFIPDLRQATASDVHAWWTTWYTPNNATLVIVGDVQADQARELVDRYFGWMPAVPEPARNVALLEPFASPQNVTLKLENAPAPGVGVAWRTVPEGHPDALALELVGTILGGGESSRLYRRLVAENRVAVMAAAMQFGFGRAGAFGAGALLSPIGGQPAQALAALRVELEKLRQVGVTRDELEKARNQAVNGLVLEAQTVDGKAHLLGRAAVVGAGIDELNSRLERLRALRQEDLQRAVNRYLEPKRALTVTVPGSGFLEQLGRLFFKQRQTEEAAPVAAGSDAVLRGRPGVTRPADLPLKPPIKEGDSPVPHPRIHDQRLANSLRLLVVTNSQTPAVEIILALNFGSWAEQKPGAAEMTLTLVPKATETHDEKALAEELDRYAIQLVGAADHDDSRLHVTCLAEHAERALALLAEVTMRPTFPSNALKTAVSQALTALTVADREPRAVSEREFARHLFGGHPYGRRVSGERADLAALKREDLQAFWHAAARPEQATLIISGAVPLDRAQALADRFFGAWKGLATTGTSASLAALPPPSPPTNASPTHIVLVDWPGAGQSEIRLGTLGPVYRDPSKPAGDLVSSYFGGSFGSRLMKAVRVEKGATYGVRGGFQPGRLAGRFSVSTFTKTDSTAETLRVVLGETRSLLDQPPSAEELARHRRYFLGSAAARFETPAQQAGQLARLALNDLPLDYVQRNFAAIEKTDADQCQALVRRVVNADRLLIVVVGDAERVAKDLAAIAPVTILDQEGKAKRME